MTSLAKPKSKSDFYTFARCLRKLYVKGIIREVAEKTEMKILVAKCDVKTKANKGSEKMDEKIQEDKIATYSERRYVTFYVVVKEG